MSEFDDFGVYHATTPDQGGTLVSEYLQNKNISFASFKVDDAVDLQDACNKKKWSPGNVLRSKILHDETGKLLVVSSVASIFDYPAICRNLSRDLEVFEDESDQLFHHYDKLFGSFTPIPGLLALSCVISDELQLSEQPDEFLYFPSGQDGTIIGVTKADYAKLIDKAWPQTITTPFKVEVDSNNVKLQDDSWLQNINRSFTHKRFKKRVCETFELPSMPHMADELLKLRVNTSATATDLAILIEKDPSLSAQLISWALSPYYNYPGKITSVEDAIVKVLGFDLVINISLGIALSHIVRMPEKGAFGLRQYWLHALYSASFIEKLLPHVKCEDKPVRGLSYLSGLLHNFGHMLIGHLLPPQLFNLNQMWALNSNYPIIQLEHILFGVDHQQVGAWLMEAWHMPQELVTAVAQHHSINYSGEHACYAQLVYIADQLIAKKGLGDGSIHGDIPAAMYTNLGLDVAKVTKVFTDFWAGRDPLYQLVNSFIK